MDYLQGDRYFKIHRDGQNLDRCRTQFKLVRDMEARWDEMATFMWENDLLEKEVAASDAFVDVTK